MLTRQTFVVFLIAVVLFEILKTIIYKINEKKRLANMTLAFLPALLITLSYYHNRGLLNHSADVLINVNFQSGSSFFQMAQHYFDFIRDHAATPFFVGLFIITCVFFTFLKSRTKRTIFIWAFFPFLVIPIFFKIAFFFSRLTGVETVGYLQDQRYLLEGSYILPVLPAFILIISLVISKISKKIIRHAITFIIILAAVFSYDNSSSNRIFFASAKEKENFIETFRDIGNHR